MVHRRNTQQHNHKPVRNRTSMIVLVLLAGVLAFTLSGCKDTMRLTEILYDQEADTVDYDNPTKVLVQDPNAEETSDQLPLIEKDVNDPEEETPEEPDYGEDESDMEIAGVVFGTSPSTTQYASTEGGTGVAQGGPSAEDEEELGGADQEIAGENGEVSGGGGDVETPGEPGGDTGSEGDIGGTTGARSGGNSTFYNEFGDFTEPPVGIDYVAAVGEAATIVSMLAGDQGALLYTDAEWASRANLSKVLGNKYNDDVVVAWNEDGDDYDLSEEMLQVMIDDERLEAVIVTSGEKTLTEEQSDRLQEAGITVISGLPDLKTAANIRSAVNFLGATFASGDNANVHAEQLANEYVDFHDRILSNAAAYADTSLDESNMQSGLPVLSSSENMFTVYVSDWVDGVTYIGSSSNKIEGGLNASNGVGIVELGYQWSPLSYYLSVGGAINTASQSSEVSGTSLLWQFGHGYITVYESDLSSSTRANPLVSTYQVVGDQGYQKIYFTSSHLRTSSDYTDGGMRGAGTSYFPYVIVNNQATKAKLEADRDSSANSLYKIYNREPFASGNVYYVGPPATAGNAPLFSTAGVTASQTSMGDNSTLYAPLSGVGYTGYTVVTNPHGMFESWTDGTIESVLETAWISNLYHGGDDLYPIVYEFYSTFYGHSLSSDEYQMIINGEVG